MRPAIGRAKVVVGLLTAGLVLASSASQAAVRKSSGSCSSSATYTVCSGYTYFLSGNLASDCRGTFLRSAGFVGGYESPDSPGARSGTILCEYTN